MNKLYQNIKTFFSDLLIPRTLAIVTYTYTVHFRKQNPVTKEHAVLAKVRRTASPDEVKSAFNLTAPKHTEYVIRNVRIVPVTNIPRV